MTALQATIGLLLLLALLYHYYRKRRARHYNTALRQALLYSLDILQRIQKHRGLGGQRTAEGRRLGQLQAQELDELWRCPPAAACELKELIPDWQALRNDPSNFDGHCRLIDRLLKLIQILELRSTEHFEIVHDCREIEDLGRLRGLAVRNANELRCPLPVQIQLRYLTQQLQSRCIANSDLARALERLSRQLIEPLQVTITPTECYALLTPLIDERFDQLRQRLLSPSESPLAKDLLITSLPK